MANEYQVEWEYSSGNSVSIKTNDLKMQINREIYEDKVIDGTIKITDTDNYQRIFTCSAMIPAADANTIHDQLIGGSIDYSGSYPRITKIYWDGSTTETNIEVYIANITLQDLGQGNWNIQLTMREKDE